MKILVVGGGGREHAIVNGLKRSAAVDEIICAPGNGGIAEVAECVNVSATDISGMTELAKKERVDFVVVAPDDPLALGMVDAMEAVGIPAFGPTAQAARIEASKIFAKDIMINAQIPTARSEVFDDAATAKAYVAEHGLPTVIKADGLAKGKGVVVAETLEEAYGAIDMMLCDRVFGAAGQSVIIEEYLEGTEVSVMCFCDGEHVAVMPASQDYKRQADGDCGQNTGGMGAIAPSPLYTADMAKRVKDEVLLPAIREMAKMGRPFKGVLYAGLMLTKKGPYVLEFNARFGDPETQVVLPLLESDLLEIMLACRNDTLNAITPEWSKDACAIVVMASAGYPASYETGREIQGLESFSGADNAWVIHAGTKVSDGKTLTNGGRVLGVAARSADLNGAVKKAYAHLEKISFEGATYRTDIGGAYMRCDK